MKRFYLLLVVLVLSVPSYSFAISINRLKKAGFSNIDISNIQKKITASCPNGINPEDSLVKEVVRKEKPHKSDDGRYEVSGEDITYHVVNTKDKCFELINAEFNYLYDKQGAFYIVDISYFSKPLIFIDYPTKYPGGPSRRYSGIVKGVDVVKYKDGEGIPREAPHFIVIQEYRKRE